MGLEQPPGGQLPTATLQLVNREATRELVASDAVPREIEARLVTFVGACSRRALVRARCKLLAVRCLEVQVPRIGLPEQDLLDREPRPPG